MHCSHGSGAQRCRSPRILCITCPHRGAVLVAFHGLRHRLICTHVPHMPSSTNPPNHDPSDCRNPSSTLHQDVYGHHAPEALRWLLLHCIRPLLTHPLSQVQDAPKRNSTDHSRMDLPGHPLLLGNTYRNCIRQWQTLHRSPRTPGKEVPREAHQDKQLQLLSKWDCRKISLRCSTGTVQSLRRSRAQMVTGSAICLLVGEDYPQKTHGLLSLLCSHWHPPPPPF